MITLTGVRSIVISFIILRKIILGKRVKGIVPCLGLWRLVLLTYCVCLGCGRWASTSWGWGQEMQDQWGIVILMVRTCVGIWAIYYEKLLNNLFQNKSVTHGGRHYQITVGQYLILFLAHMLLLDCGTRLPYLSTHWIHFSTVGNKRNN